MAKNETKHKSKYKEAKDMAKSQKIEARKDLKDYTAPDAHGMVPDLVDGVQPLVPRNINGEVLADIENMVPEIKNRVYQDVEEGKYSPREARKVFEKLQIEDTENYIDVMENGVYIKESISKLSEDQKEQLVRKYVRKKIVKVLREQDEPIEEPLEDTPPAEDPGMAAPPAEEPTGETPEPIDPVDTPEPESSAEDLEKEHLKHIEKSPEYFKEYLAIHQQSMNIPLFVQKGLDPLLDIIFSTVDDEMRPKALNMIKQALRTAPKDYAKKETEDLENIDSENDIA